jgi:hypothetical protein
MEDKYNEIFSIPEMVKTAKSLCNRLQKDSLFLLLIIFYICIHKSFDIPIIQYTFDYKGSNIIYTLILFWFFYIAITNHIYKIYILYRQIDDEVKEFYSSDLGKQDLLRLLHSSSHMTSFIISENFVSDFVLTGSERHPSIRRIIGLQLLIMLIAIIITFILLYELIGHSDWLLWFLISCIFNVFFQYIIMKMYFIKRSAFLYKTALGKEIIIQYWGLLSLLYKYAKDHHIDKLEILITKIMANFRKINLGNIFDDNWHMNMLGSNLQEIKDELNKLSEADKNVIKFDESFQEAVNNVNRQPEENSYSLIEKVFTNYNKYKESSLFEFAFNYHSRHLHEYMPKNIFQFLSCSLK